MSSFRRHPPPDLSHDYLEAHKVLELSPPPRFVLLSFMSIPQVESLEEKSCQGRSAETETHHFQRIFLFSNAKIVQTSFTSHHFTIYSPLFCSHSEFPSRSSSTKLFILISSLNFFIPVQKGCQGRRHPQKTRTYLHPFCTAVS